MENSCECFACTNLKQAAEDTALAEFFVNDNIHHAKLGKNYVEYGKCSMFCRWPAVESPNTNGTHFVDYADEQRWRHGVEDYAQRYDEWEDVDHIHLCKVEATNLLDLVERHSSPFVSTVWRETNSSTPGFLNVTEHEHERIVTWTPNVASFRPPAQVGRKSTNALSAKTRRRIHRVGDWLRWKHGKKLGFLTLTYDRHICDYVAKRHLDTLFKRVKRSKECSFHDHLWVAERQKDGKLHFHVLFGGYIPKEWVNHAWTEIAGQEIDGKLKPLFPNVKGAQSHTVGYLTKYMAKADRTPISGRRWGASARASHKSLPIRTRSTAMDWNDFVEFWDGVPLGSQDVVFRNGFLTKKE